jgi:hypothetical protein
MGMQNRKKNIDKIRKPFVARPCACASLVKVCAAGGEHAHHNSVLPGKEGEVRRLSDESVASCDVTGNEECDRKQPVCVARAAAGVSDLGFVASGSILGGGR